jgi:L-type amino acid transporter 9
MLPSLSFANSSEKVEKAGIADDVKDVKLGYTTSDAASSEYDTSPGDLTLEEDAAGGQGRHLGVFTCTLLVYALPSLCSSSSHIAHLL